MQPIAGYNYGAKKYDRVKSTMMLSIVLVVVMCGVLSSPTFLWPSFFVRMFVGEEEELIEVASRGLWMYSLSLPFFGVCFIASRYFQAIGKGVKAIVLSTFKPMVVFLPVMYLLGAIWGLDGIWATEPASGIFSAAIILGYLVYDSKKNAMVVEREAERVAA